LAPLFIVYFTAMRFGKLTMFLILQGLILLVLAVHLGRWLFSDTVEGQVTTPYSATMMTVHYTVDGIGYADTYMRNGYPLTPKTVGVRYLTYNPSISRIDSFMGIGAEALGWWFVISLGLFSLLLTDNTVFSKGTIFQLHRRFPWISMDEYFPIKSRWFYRGGQGEYGAGKSPDKGANPRKQQLPDHTNM
jgi:hypothetical protein